MESGDQQKHPNVFVMGHTLGHPTPYIVCGTEAILGGLSAQVYHLVEAKLAAVD